MATNPHFSRYSEPEQELIEDLTIESIKMYGHDMVYIVRETVNEDEIFGEDITNNFTDGREVEMFIESVDGFEGDGDFISKFGLDIRDSMSLVVSKKRWEEVFVGTAVTGATRPREGDLIYFPLSKGLFEITFVEHENPFYQLGKNYTYKMNCELFRYSGEDITTGWTDIDDEVNEYKDFAIDLVLIAGGTGTYTVGETVNQGTTTAKVIAWTSATRTLRISELVGTVTTGSNIIGSSSGATWLYDTSSGSSSTTTTVNTGDGDSSSNDNVEIDFELNDIVDFTENNPFGEDLT